MPIGLPPSRRQDTSKESSKSVLVHMNVERRLDDRDYLVVYLDGIQFAGHHVLVALGVDAEGKKRLARSFPRRA